MFGGHNNGSHACGCFVIVEYERRYLPQVDVSAHSTIYSTTSCTTLTQHFTHPDQTKALDEVQYVFPLYDGVSVVGFTCTIGDRVIRGVVKERQKAKKAYAEAKAKGQTAGIFQQSPQASDTFSTTIGNVPAGATVKVDITYIGELKHDAEVDGLRFTIPTTIFPRYASRETIAPTGSVKTGTMEITVDTEMPTGYTLKKLTSPSHPIAVGFGTTSKEPDAEPSMQKASAALSQKDTYLEKDFVLQVVITNLANPTAVLEVHPTIPNQRAIMATLVPQFKLPLEKPEIVFVCDRSGSMTSNMDALKAALRIFLKSVPVGVKFNICSFGSHHSFLWEKSQTYSQESLDKAMSHVGGFQADYGGTEMYEPVSDTFKQRYKDMNLNVFLLTDGEIWDQERLVNLVNENVSESKGAIRVFTLGVGDGVSHSLIESVARAGNGFSQAVGNDEKMDKRVVRMLKGALFPHINDYSLEVTYKKKPDVAPDDDFEIVENVMDALTIEQDSRTETEEPPKKTISLFNANLKDNDGNTESPGAADGDRYEHLPTVETPRYLQAPFAIPPLFPFNRTTIYVMISDSAPEQQPVSIRLRATSKHGPLELEVPITQLPEKGVTIHQLAAKKAVQELEEGRGWIQHAKDKDGKLLKEKYEGRFSDMVEREAVLLGERYQVAGKWCSFIAVDENSPEALNEVVEEQETVFQTRGMRAGGGMMARKKWFSAAPMAAPMFGAAPMAAQAFGSSGTLMAVRQSSNSMGSPPTTQKKEEEEDDDQGVDEAFETVFCDYSALPSPPPPILPVSAAPGALTTDTRAGGTDTCALFGGFSQKRFLNVARKRRSKVHDEFQEESVQEEELEPMQALVMLQTFAGNWSWSPELEKVLGIKDDDVKKLNWPENIGGQGDVMATVCAIAFFRKRLAEDEESWEMVVGKAVEWVEEQTGEDVEKLEGLVAGLF